MKFLLPDLGSGSGSSLPLPLLISAGLATAVATVVSAMSIFLHLRNYRKPHLQRMVVRIMVMVPLYAISSLISLFSLQAAFFIDAVRDIYEAFVIYCFFDLLVEYLGGERSLLILLHGRPPKYPVFPSNLFWREVDVSDPYTYLFLKRGVLQYVQVKPLLAIATIVLKAAGKFNEGDLRFDSGYLYVSVVYNFSICMSLYCLAMFWMCVNNDLKPFRPVPKFLCVKGILFFSFWQSLIISILVTAGVITKLGPYTDNEHISLGLTDCLICLEMPFFAFAHQYAFSASDFIDPHALYVARMPMYHAFRDAFGFKDVVEDTKATLRGEGMDYRDFEPSEGHMHQGEGRERRIRAGLRYTQGGKGKYWLPQPARESLPPGGAERRVNRVIDAVTGRADQTEEVYAPLLAEQAEGVVHLAPDLRAQGDLDDIYTAVDLTDEGYDLPFGDIDDADEELFQHCRKYLFGDYNYPVVDVSNEFARIQVWDEEERILRDERGAYFSPILGPNPNTNLNPKRAFGKAREQGYGSTGHFQRSAVREYHHGEEDDSPRMSRTSSLTSTPTTIRPRGSHSPLRQQRQAVIDKEQARIPDMIPPGNGVGGKSVRLGWTNSQGLTVQAPPMMQRARTTSSSSKPTPNGRPSTSGAGSAVSTNARNSPRVVGGNILGGGGVSGSGLGSVGPGLIGDTAKSKPSPSPGPTPRLVESGKKMLPPDAVDLIVEDRTAAQDEMTHERRKGEPAVRGGDGHGGLKKVYRRGYMVDDEDIGDDDNDDGHGVMGRRGEVEAKFSVNGDEESEEDVDEIFHEEDEAAATVASEAMARAHTPPPHARVVRVEQYAMPSEDENPWA